MTVTVTPLEAATAPSSNAFYWGLGQSGRFPNHEQSGDGNNKSLIASLLKCSLPAPPARGQVPVCKRPEEEVSVH